MYGDVTRIFFYERRNPSLGIHKPYKQMIQMCLSQVLPKIFGQKSCNFHGISQNGLHIIYEMLVRVMLVKEAFIKALAEIRGKVEVRLTRTQ